MSDIKIFRLTGKDASEIEGTSAYIEKSLQTLIENHLEIFFGIRFLASEYAAARSPRPSAA